MNYTLSTCADRVHGKRCFVLTSEGNIVAEKISKFEGINIKENALECLCAGLRVAKTVLTHNDLLIIEIQNSHLLNWLKGAVDNKEYSKGLDKVFSLIESTDCRYRYLLKEKPLARVYMQEKGISEVKTVGVDDMMSEFEGGTEE